MKTFNSFIVWIVLFIVSLPLALNLVRQNRIYGFRTASTLSNPKLWRRGNVFAGWTLMAAAVIGAGLTFLFPGVLARWEAVFLIVLLAVAIVTSFVYIKRIDKGTTAGK